MFTFYNNIYFITILYSHLKDNIMLPRGLVLDRTEKMILDLCKKLDRTKPIVALCVLKGGYEEQYQNMLLI